MKKICLLILLSVILLVSCGTQPSDTAVTTVAEDLNIISEEERAEIEKKLVDTSFLEGYDPAGFICRSVCDGGDCYYIVGQAFMHHVLYRMDKTTLKCEILCDISGCQHNKNTCQACFGGALDNIVYDDGRLYWLSSESVSDSTKLHISNVIWCMNLETKVKTRLGEIVSPEEAQSNHSFGKGCAIAMSVIYGDDGTTHIGTRLNLKTKEKTELFRKNIKMHSGSQYLYDNSFYYAAAYNEGSGKASVCAYKWDLNSGEETELVSQSVDESWCSFSESGDADGIDFYSSFPDYAGGATAYRLDYGDGQIKKIAAFDFSEYGSRYEYTENPKGSICGFLYSNGVMYAMVKTSGNSLTIVGKDESGSEVFKTNVENLNVTDFVSHVLIMGADDSYIFLGFMEQNQFQNYQMNIVVAVPTDGSEPVVVGEHISDLSYTKW